MQLNPLEARKHIQKYSFLFQTLKLSDMNRFRVSLEQVSLAGSQMYKYLSTISGWKFGSFCLQHQPIMLERQLETSMPLNYI